MYKVIKNGARFGVRNFDVETYVRNGFDLYKDSELIIEDVDEEMNKIQKLLDNAVVPSYFARKDNVAFQIQPFRIPEFYDRGYTIFTKTTIKVDDVEKEIEQINATLNN